MLFDPLHSLFRINARREQVEKLPVRAHQVRHNRMVHGIPIVVVLVRRHVHLAPVHTVRLGRCVDLLGHAREPGERRVKVLAVLAQLRDRIAARVYRYEQRLDLASHVRVGLQRVKNLADLDKLVRANVGALCETKVDEQELAAKVGVRAQRAVGVEQRPRAADHRLADGLGLRRLRAVRRAPLLLGIVVDDEAPDDVLSSVKLFVVVCEMVGASFCNEIVGV